MECAFHFHKYSNRCLCAWFGRYTALPSKFRNKAQWNIESNMIVCIPKQIVKVDKNLIKKLLSVMIDKKSNCIFLLMTNSRRRTKMSLETAISQFIVINLTNITGSNVRIRTGQKNKKIPLKEFFWFPVYLHFQQILSLKKIFVSKPQALF